MKQNEWARLLRDYHAAKVAADKAKSLSDTIKAAMVEAGVDRVEAGGFIATMTDVCTTRLDSKRLKADYADLYAAYTATSTSKRLNIK